MLVQKFVRPTRIEKWAVVDFSARTDIQCLVQNIIKSGEKMGIVSYGLLKHIYGQYQVIDSLCFVLFCNSS